jgi:cytochrome o ubiquinol oxidase subunit 2
LSPEVLPVESGARARQGIRSWLIWPVLALVLLPLGGCGSETYRLFHPKGPVAAAALKFTFIDVGVMLLIILPTFIMICVFIWRYQRRRNAHYDPVWAHSMPIEFLVWGAPLVIVAILAVFSYQSVVQVNPYDPTVLNGPNHTGAAAEPPLLVDVITTDWQWFFIYPAQHIATIDELVVPKGRNVRIRLTSTSVTNDFYIPQLAPMMDVMPSMQTQDAFRADTRGTFTGFSADFSGAGFAWMQFATHVVSGDEFKTWVGTVQQGQTQPNDGVLSYALFQKLAHPTLNIGAKPRYFSGVDPTVFDTTMIAARRGVTYPVPGDLTEKMAPKAGPITSKAAGS